MSASKPGFHSVLDLGLRDVGVRNEPRRLAAHFGRWTLPLVPLAVVFAVLACAVLRRAGAGLPVIVAYALLWSAIVFVVALRAVKRAPITVVKVDASGTNQATWFALAPCGVLVLLAVVTRELLMLPVVALAMLLAALVWRGRRRVPALLRTVAPQIAAGEPVLGDGLGLARGAGGRRHEALRIVVATDRRLLLAAPSGIVDVDYGAVRRFGIEWKVLGRIGELSLTIGDETQVITSIAPANLVSIARALLSHGVPADDPAAVSDAERAWEEALLASRTPRRWFDRASMRTREFDHGLWLLLGLGAAAFYVNSFGVGLGMSRDAVPALLAVPVVSGICGYVSRTRSSLAYVAPLDLLLTPVFFFADAGDAIALMAAVTGLAGIGLWIGSRLRERRASPPASRASGPARGSLRYAVSGVRLVRVSAVLLAVMTVSAAGASAAGFDLSSIRRGVEEVTAERLPVDGRSDLTGGAASLTYTPGPGLRELVTDEDGGAGPNDGARWELRSAFTDGFNAITLSHYIFNAPRLDDRAAVAAFVAGKDRDHSELAGFRVGHTERVVDGRRGYVWDHFVRGGYWYFTAWFPQPVHTVRLECIARSQTARFKRLCAEAVRSLEFAPDGP